MKKTEQVRLPVELMRDVRSTSSVFDEAPNEYIERIVREALKRDMPKAAKLLTKRAEQADASDDN